MGDWIETEPPNKIKDSIEIPLEHFYRLGYTFEKNGKVITKPGFINYRDNKYYGSRSQYKIKDGYVSVYNPSVKKWDKLKIIKLTQDSLEVLDGDIPYYYIKKKYNTASNPDFDGVIVTNSGGYIPLANQINTVFINPANHNVIYNRNIDDGQRVTMQGHISGNDLSLVQQLFKQADYIKRDSVYGEMVYDVSQTSVAVLKGNRIIKSIHIYNREPTELLWAHLAAHYLPDVVTNIRKTDEFSLGMEAFEAANSTLSLTKAEGYFLSYLLSSSKSTPLQFKELYRLTYSDDAVGKITSDGRYYKYYFKDKTTKTVDIGYNFITGNKLVNTFKPNEHQ
ncbi:hypothetical protein AM493_07890 [Flavobacterium akiainvivens]|uniref:Uncharacterized protein n=1 Tax=Flavobacterium akiainvivens TaxID=1202724 RepID=A0A0M8MHM6_9FLAO|nr:hypothetical protein AM493_07890 [Flavobacterium akiainvivens]